METSSSIKAMLTEIGLNPNLMEFYPQDESWRDGLTRRDIAFCHMVSKGTERGDAFRIAYSSQIGTISGLREAAWRKLKNVMIQEELKRLINDKVQPLPVADADWLQHTVLTELVSVIQDREIAPANRIRASEVILRHIGMMLVELAKTRPGEPIKTPLEEIEQILRKENQQAALPAPDDLPN